LITICIAAFTHQAGIKQFFKVFVFLSLLNSFFLIAEAVITKDRAFGLAGVMFVDYVGIAIVIVFIWFLMIKTENKFFLLPILIVLILASLFTQTRNSWISIFVLVFLITTFFYFSSKKYGLSRRFLLTIMLLIILSIVGIYASLKIITPSVSERAEQFKDK
jgi:hypothetical protein